MTLLVAFSMVHFEGSVGNLGLKGSYDHVSCLNVDKHFELWVHGEYKHRFHLFAKELRGDSGTTSNYDQFEGDLNT